MASGTHIQMEVNAYIKYWISQSIPPDENVDDYVITDSIPDSSDSVDSESQNQNDDVEVLEDSEIQHTNPESVTSDPKETDNNVYTDFQNFTNSAPNVFVVANFSFPSSNMQHDVVLPISTGYDSVPSKESNADFSEQDTSRDPKPYLTDLDTVKSHASNLEVQSGGDTPCIIIDSESDTELYELVDQASVSNKTPSTGPESDAVTSTTYPHSSSGDHYSSDTEISHFKNENRFHPYQSNSKKKVKGIPTSHVKNIKARYRRLLEYGARRLYRLYPMIWKGALILKSLKSNVEFKILNGNAIVANMCLLKVNKEVSISLLQKVQWTAQTELYIDTKCPDDQILMLVLPEKDQPGSFNDLRGIGGYLQETRSSGFVVTENISGVHFAVMLYPKNFETMKALKQLDKEVHTLLLNEYFLFGIIKQLV